MKVTRDHVIAIIAESLVEPHFPDDAIREAEYILKKLEKYGVIAKEQEEFDPIAYKTAYNKGYIPDESD